MIGCTFPADDERRALAYTDCLGGDIFLRRFLNESPQTSPTRIQAGARRAAAVAARAAGVSPCVGPRPSHWAPLLLAPHRGAKAHGGRRMHCFSDAGLRPKRRKHLCQALVPDPSVAPTPHRGA